jgi:hypothetical protein
VHKKKRLENSGTSQTRPINLYVELLVVTDETVYEHHEQIANTNDRNQVFWHMKMYFAYIVNGMNQRFANSLAFDPDLRVNIVLKNFLFLTVENFFIFHKKQQEQITSNFFFLIFF